MQRVRQGIGKSREQDPRFGMGAGQMGGPVKRHDGLARAGGAGDAGWSGIVALDPLPLFGMQEDCPFLPREIEGALQFLDVGHHAEAALGIGMIERIRGGRRRCSDARFAARGKFQQGFGCLAGQVIGQATGGCLSVACANVVQPLGGHAVAQKFVVGQSGEEARLPGGAGLAISACT